MTNEMIIFMQSQKLAEEGLIRFTGREFTVTDEEGNEITMQETEPIHTFAHWKALGFAVKKGEKAIAQFTIWKCTKQTVKLTDKEGNEITENHKKMFMKKASFFSLSQVEVMQEVTA